MTKPSRFYVSALVVFLGCFLAHRVWNFETRWFVSLGWALMATGKQIGARRDKDTGEAFWAGTWAMLALYMLLEAIVGEV